MFSVAERWVAEDNAPPVNAAYTLGLDLGQSQDYTALCIIERIGGSVGSRSEYHVRRLERELGRPYPDVIRRVKNIMAQLRRAVLVIDQTGVGRPVVDSFEEAALRPIAISIHGGAAVSNDGNGPYGEMPRRWRVPKRDLVGVLQVLLQNKRLKVAPGPLSDTLVAEMLNFRVKIDPTTAHDSYSAWREGQHDDLVLSVALACWWGENKPHVPLASVYALRCARGSY